MTAKCSKFSAREVINYLLSFSYSPNNRMHPTCESGLDILNRKEIQEDNQWRRLIC